MYQYLHAMVGFEITGLHLCNKDPIIWEVDMMVHSRETLDPSGLKTGHYQGYKFIDFLESHNFKVSLRYVSDPFNLKKISTTYIQRQL